MPDFSGVQLLGTGGNARKASTLRYANSSMGSTSLVTQ
jgi:hypothetical protein